MTRNLFRYVRVFVGIIIMMTCLRQENVFSDEAADLMHQPEFVFEDNLYSAEAFVLKLVDVDRLTKRKTYKEFPSKLENKIFAFPQLENEPEIALLSKKYGDDIHAGISFQPSAHGNKVLKFFEVPTGSKMLIGYGVDEEDSKRLKGEATIYLRIRAGRHEIIRLRIPNEAGWHEKVIDLGVVSLLKQGVSMTFEISADDTEIRTFVFSASIFR